MRASYPLTQAAPSQTITLDWPARWLVVFNPTASPVYLRLTGPDAPTLNSADLWCPPTENIVVPVHGNTFGATLGFPGNLGATNTPASGLGSTATLTLYDETEPPPNFSSINFQSFALADILPGLQPFAAATTFGPFDLGAWGGLLLELFGDGGAGQMVAQLQTSPDQTTWAGAGAWPLYPGTVLQLGLPRYARYARVSITAAPLIGGTVAGNLLIRATLAELQQASALASSAAKPFSATQASPANIALYAVGLPTLDLAATFTAVAAGSVVTVAGSNDGVTYSQLYADAVTASGRWQRTLELPPPFLNVTISNTGGVATTAGTLSYRASYLAPAPPQYLGQVPVYAADGALVAVGTTTDAAGTPTAIGQLKQIQGNTSASSSAVANIGTPSDVVNASYQGTVIAELHELVNALIQGGSLHGGVDTAGATSLLGQLRQTAAALGAGGSAAGGSLDGPQAVTNTASSLLGQLKNMVAVLAYGGNVAAAVDGAGSTSIIGQLRSIRADDDVIVTNTAGTATNTLAVGNATGTSGDTPNTNTLIGLAKQTAGALGAGGAAAAASLDGPQAVTNTASSLLGQLKNMVAVLAYGGNVAAAVDGAGSTSIIGQLRSIHADDDVIVTNTGTIATNTGTIATQTTATATNTSTVATQTTAINTNTSNTATSAAAAAAALGTTGDAPSLHTVVGLLNNIADVLAYGSSANPTLDTSAGASLLASMRQTAALLGQIGNASSPDGAGASSILGQLKSIKLDADTLVVQTGAISQIGTNTTLRSALTIPSTTAVAASTWTNTGLSMGANAFITAVTISHILTVSGAATGMQLAVGIGTAGALSTLVTTAFVWTGIPFTIEFTGAGVRGYSVGSNDRIWVFGGSATTLGYTVAYTF